MVQQTKEEVFEQLKQIIHNNTAIYGDDITMESTLEDELDLDSLDKIELVMECEKGFNISIPDAETEDIESVAQLVDVIYAKVS